MSVLHETLRVGEHSRFAERGRDASGISLLDLHGLRGRREVCVGWAIRPGPPSCSADAVYI